MRNLDDNLYAAPYICVCMCVHVCTTECAHARACARTSVYVLMTDVATQQEGGLPTGSSVYLSSHLVINLLFLSSMQAIGITAWVSFSEVTLLDPY